MPDRDVKTIRELIYYQYAKIVAKSAFAFRPYLDNCIVQRRESFENSHFLLLMAGDVCRKDKRLRGGELTY